ncbi:MAG: lamin tail domain-containing protein, partial [Deltaproteobacteria bacterium]|nr:lamin tail domain-containing protein [Deltaproteobacteria bacterium]
FCTLEEKCFSGECKGTAELFCTDDNPCTDDECVSGKGCEFTNNTAACSDDNLCTDGDKCENGDCVSGVPVECDNGVFCDGAEWCDVEKGCQNGSAPTCSDDNPCTEDKCDPNMDKCVNLKFPWAKEGAFGSDTCSDLMDNDCDSLIDGKDPQCGFQILAAVPSFGTDQGGEEVLIMGGSLTLAKTVRFGDDDAEFTIISDDELIAVTPAHAAGDVHIIISDGEVSYILDNGFRFSALSENPELFARLNAPLEETVVEHEETEELRGEFSDNNLTLTGGNGDKIIAQIGYGERGTNPYSHGSWKWLDAVLEDDTSGKYFYKTTLKIKNGGYFDYAFRFSTDSALSFVYGDSGAGSSDGYDPENAGKLTVYGVPDPGEVVVNELMWMGSNSDPWDEWFELRNMTKAPVILSGWTLTGAGVLGADFLLDDGSHIVNNIIGEPEGYCLVAEYGYDKSAVDTQPDVVGVASLVLTNTPPETYYLKDASGNVIDEVLFSGKIGFNGDEGEQEKSMERVKSAGAGNDDKNWFTAFHSRGFKGDPFQETLIGSPRWPNGDIPECGSDEECADFLPVAIPQCAGWSCDVEILKCEVAAKDDGSLCDDGLFCTVNDICFEGECLSGPAADCSDESPCTEDKK